MPTAGPFKGILAKGAGDLVDPATGFASVFVTDHFLVFGLAKSRRKSVRKVGSTCNVAIDAEFSMEFLTGSHTFRIERRS